MSEHHVKRISAATNKYVLAIDFEQARCSSMFVIAFGVRALRPGLQLTGDLAYTEADRRCVRNSSRGFKLQVQSVEILRSQLGRPPKPRIFYNELIELVRRERHYLGIA